MAAPGPRGIRWTRCVRWYNRLNGVCLLCARPRGSEIVRTDSVAKLRASCFGRVDVLPSRVANLMMGYLTKKKKKKGEVDMTTSTRVTLKDW